LDYGLASFEDVHQEGRTIHVDWIGQLIYDVRHIIGLTPKAIAESGQLSESYVISLEQGGRLSPSKKYLIKIAKGLRLYEDEYSKLEIFSEDEEAWKNALHDAVYNKGAYYAVQKIPSPFEDFDPKEFYGREALIQQINNTITTNSVGLYGLDGIGKTMLAKAIVSKVQGQFSGGYAYISLHSYSTEEDIEAALIAPFYYNGNEWIRKQFNFEIDRARSIIGAAFEETFGESNTNPKILIVDDVEYAHIHCLNKILSTYFQQSRVIIISNKSILGYLSLSIFHVPPFSLEEALQLLLDNNHIEQSITTQRELEELAEAVTYHPLSLRIIRYLINPEWRYRRDPFSLLSQIKTEILRFGDGIFKRDNRITGDFTDKTIPEKHRFYESATNEELLKEGHRAVFRIAYEGLAKVESSYELSVQEAFRTLCVFAESISVIPAAALRSIWHETEGGVLSVAQFNILCGSLEQSGLIQIDKQHDGIRIHALILHFADECMTKWGETGERHLATIKHMKFYGLTSSVLEEDARRFSTAARAYREYSHQIQKNVGKNIRQLATIDISDKVSERVYVDFFESIAYFEGINPLYAKEREIALTIIKNSEYRTVSENWALLHIGNAQMLQGRYESAQECYSQIVHDLRHHGSFPDITVSTSVHAASYIGLANAQANIFFQKNPLNEEDFTAAVTYLKKARHIAINLSPPNGEMMFYALSSLGDLYMSRLDREQGMSEPKILNGYRQKATHNYTDAFNLFRSKPANHRLSREKAPIFQTPAVFNPRLQVILYRKLGDVCAAERKFIEAIDYYQRSRKLAQSIGFHQAIHDSYWREAELCDQYGYKNRAQMLYEEARVLKKLKLSAIELLQ